MASSVTISEMSVTRRISSSSSMIMLVILFNTQEKKSSLQRKTPPNGCWSWNMSWSGFTAATTPIPIVKRSVILMKNQNLRTLTQKSVNSWWGEWTNTCKCGWIWGSRDVFLQVELWVWSNRREEESATCPQHGNNVLLDRRNEENWTRGLIWNYDHCVI